MFFAILYGLPKISDVHLLYSFIHVYMHNSVKKIIGNFFSRERRLEKPLSMSWKIPCTNPEKYAYTDQYCSHLSITNNFGNVTTIWQTSLGKNFECSINT